MSDLGLHCLPLSHKIDAIEHFCYLCLVLVAFSCRPVHCNLVVTCWERTELLTLLCVMFYCVFVTFPCGVLDQVWCLIVSIPDLCLLSYFYMIKKKHIVMFDLYIHILSAHFLILGYELLSVLSFSPKGIFVDYVFHKAYYLTIFLKHVSPLVAGAFGCYSVLITLPLI